MLKNYDKLWVFGDSYTTPNVCVAPQDSFWGLLASHIGISVIKNCSRPVNSFDAVCQLLVGLQDEINWNQDMVLIGIPPLERIAVFDDYNDTEYLVHSIDTSNWHDESFDIPCHRGLVSLQNYGIDKELIIHHDRAWLETQTLRTVFFLTKWLDSIDATYMILNLSKDLDVGNKWGPSNFVLPYCMNHPRGILFKDTYYSVNLNVNEPADFKEHGWMGHHGPSGNCCFFEKSIKPKLEELFC